MKRAFQRAGTPLAFYYAITLALPLANGTAGPAFLEHALAVLAVPPTLVMLFCTIRGSVLLLLRRKRAPTERWHGTLPAEVRGWVDLLRQQLSAARVRLR